MSGTLCQGLKGRISLSKKFELSKESEFIEEILENGGELSFISAGTSMLPTIGNKTDKIFLSKLKRKPKKRDIVFYCRTDGSYILHRIVGKNKNGYILCGDNQDVKEYGIKPEQIKAVLTKLEKNGKLIRCDSLSFRLKGLFLPLYKLLRKTYSKILEMK